MPSSRFHSLIAWPSAVVGQAASFGIGHALVPSKWPHQCMASMASRKCVAKLDQLEASSSRHGTEFGRTRKDIVML